MKKMQYVYWQHEDMWLGYLQKFPDYWTQGETLEDLRENLKDLYGELTSGKAPKPAVSPSCTCHETSRSHSPDRAERLQPHPAPLVSEPENRGQPVPRHREIKEPLAKHILKELQG